MLVWTGYIHNLIHPFIYLFIHEQEGMTLVGCKRMGEEVKKALAAL